MRAPLTHTLAQLEVTMPMCRPHPAPVAHRRSSGRDQLGRVVQTAFRLERHLCWRLGSPVEAWLDRSAPDYELIVRSEENPIVVPTHSQMRDRLRAYFEAAYRLDDARSRAPHRGAGIADVADAAALDAEQFRQYDRTVLDPLRAELATATTHLVDDLAVGGPTPLRWTWQRWARRARFVGWYLREGRHQRARRSGRGLDEEPAF